MTVILTGWVKGEDHSNESAAEKDTEYISFRNKPWLYSQNRKSVLTGQIFSEKHTFLDNSSFQSTNEVNMRLYTLRVTDICIYFSGSNTTLLLFFSAG